MKQAIIFTLKVWLTAVFVAPLLIIGIQMLRHNYDLANWAAYYVAIVVGGMFSIPSAALLLLAVNLLKRPEGQVELKSGLSFIGILLTILTMVLFCKGLPNGNEVFYTEIYAFVIVAGVWLCKLKPAEQLAEVSVD